MTNLSLALTGGVGLAGALGALIRYLLGRLVGTRITFPLATFVINLSGAFLIGFLFALAKQKVIAAQVQLVLATGFLGGYTTFSTFSWEALQLWRRANARISLFYLIGSMALGLVVVAAGLGLGTVVAVLVRG